MVDELGGERIDMVRWSESVKDMIINALEPAPIESIVLHATEHRARVVVKEEHLSIAMGRGGLNRELASSLCAWNIELVTRP
jgi:N utilization substance protein A